MEMLEWDFTSISTWEWVELDRCYIYLGKEYKRMRKIGQLEAAEAFGAIQMIVYMELVRRG